MKEKTQEELEAGLEHVLSSPKEAGSLEMIVRRPEVDEREILEIGELSREEGLVGDNWRTRGSQMTEDGSSHPDMQLNLMNARVIDLVSGDRSHWALAGDQLFLDLDLSPENLPPGSQLGLGDAVIEVTDVPHLGCSKFAARFGADAAVFVNSRRGKRLNLRGINARVVQGGSIRVGDTVRKL